MKTGTEIIDTIKADLKKIDDQIKQLESENAKLDDQLGKLEDDFSIEAVNKQKDLLGQKNVYERALKKAEKHRLTLIEERTDKTIDDSLQVVKQMKTDAQKQVDKRSEKISKKVEEVRSLFTEITDIDKNAKIEIEKFARDLKPYVSDKPREDITLYGDPQPVIEKLSSQTRNFSDTTNFLVVTRAYQESKDGIDGLIKAK